MASVHRRPRSPFWFACWRNPEGKLRMRSTKLTSRSKALRMAMELESTERRMQEGRITVEAAVRAITDVAQELGQTAELPSSIAVWFREWLKEREGHVADSTMVNYRKAIDDLIEFLGQDADRPLPWLTASRLQHWVNKLSTRDKLSPGTVRIYCEPIRAATKRAWHRGLIDADVSSELELPKKQSADKAAFSADEIEKLLAVADQEWRLAIMFGAFAGLRLGDATSLTWRNVELTTATLRLEVEKTGRSQTLPLHPRLLDELSKLTQAEPDTPLCPALKDRDSRGTNGLSGQFAALVKRAGIEVRSVGSGVRKVTDKTFHSLRHSFVRRLLAAGVDDTTRMKLAGHTSKQAHSAYSKPEFDQLRSAVNKV